MHNAKQRLALAVPQSSGELQPAETGKRVVCVYVQETEQKALDLVSKKYLISVNA